MKVAEDTLVPVQPSWDAWQTTECRIGDLQELHWFQPPGAPRPILHAYVAPSKLSPDAISHQQGNSPEKLRVCVLKSHTVPDIYQVLASRAVDASIPRA